jgi:hypothetical protein
MINRSITSLGNKYLKGMSANAIANDGAFKLAEAIEVNNTLERTGNFLVRFKLK